MIKKLVCVAGASLLAVAAQAATVSYTNSIPLSTTNWSNALTLQQFDSTLGNLTGVSFAFSGLVSTLFKIESLDAAPSTVTTQTTSSLTFGGPIGQTLHATGSTTQSLGVFDGLIDFGGTSGASIGPVTGSDSGVFNLLGSFAVYIGLGTYDIAVDATGVSTATGAGNLISQINTQSGASITVTYTYDQPQQQVPEPTTLALAGLALAGAGFASRRRKTS